MDVPGETAPSVPADIDVSKPNSARLYDWYLGGAGNFAVDREFGQRIVEEFPLIRPMAVSNRRWLGRLVRAAARAGITQFLDLGSGVPTVGNVHEIAAQELGVGAGRVVYVDNEHVAAEHAQLTLEDQGAQRWAGVVQEDYRRPDAVLHHETTAGLLDFTRPVCVIFASVLHFVGPGDDPAALLQQYRDVLAPSSWLALSHPTAEADDEHTAEQMRTAADSYRQSGTPVWFRDQNEIKPWLAGLTLLEPGLVRAPDWRPELDATPALSSDEADVRGCYWCAVGEVSAAS